MKSIYININFRRFSKLKVLISLSPTILYTQIQPELEQYLLTDVLA